MSDDEHILSADDLTGGGLGLVARGVVDGTLAGLHKSAQKGSSALFKQHRPYVPGDDLRSLDWKVYGKTDRFFVREFEDQTNLRATLLLDASASMNYGAGRARKLRHAVALAASLAHLMLRQQDAVGLATFAARLDVKLPAKAGPRQFGLLSDALAAVAPTRGDTTDFDRIFADLARRSGTARRGLNVVVSDCFGDLDALRRGLQHLRHGRHEAVLFHVLHRDEIDFPFAGNVRFRDLESAGVRDLDARLLRSRYLAKLAAFRDGVRLACDKAGADLVPVVTDEPVGVALRRYLTRRARTRRAA